MPLRFYLRFDSSSDVEAGELWPGHVPWPKEPPAQPLLCNTHQNIRIRTLSEQAKVCGARAGPGRPGPRLSPKAPWACQPACRSPPTRAGPGGAQESRLRSPLPPEAASGMVSGCFGRSPWAKRTTASKDSLDEPSGTAKAEEVSARRSLDCSGVHCLFQQVHRSPKFTSSPFWISSKLQGALSWARAGRGLALTCARACGAEAQRLPLVQSCTANSGGLGVCRLCGAAHAGLVPTQITWGEQVRPHRDSMLQGFSAHLRHPCFLQYPKGAIPT